MYYTLLSIAIGSVLGGWLRWFVGLKLNAIFPAIPMGTVAVNLVGAFIIGFAMSYFSTAAINPNYRLFLVTGFCGGLTTFSTFSVEMVALLQDGRIGWMLGGIALHVVGSLCLTCIGILSQQWLSSAA